MKGECPKCHRVGKLTKHHILPKRFYFLADAGVIYLCRSCHDQLERRIPFKPKRTPRWYYGIVRKFLGDETYEKVRHPDWESAC